MRLNIVYALLAGAFVKSDNHHNWLPPNDGKSFYADLIREQDTSISEGKINHHSRLHTTIFVGDSGKQLNLWVTSMEEHLALVTTQCPITVCQVPQRWNFFDSSAVEGNQFSSNYQEEVYLFNGQYV